MEFKGKMEWNISPFKDKNVPELVATPGWKWSTGEPKLNPDAFRSRLHSSPYVEDEYIPRPHDIKKDKLSIPRLCLGDDQIDVSTSALLVNTESATDSGISSGLQQTRFYENISASRYPHDSGILSASSGLSKFDSQNFLPNQSGSIDKVEEDQQKDVKYAFDPLAPPFKPRSSNLLQVPGVRFDRASVKAIDVANYVNSRYRDEFAPRDANLKLGDITNHLGNKLASGKEVPATQNFHRPVRKCLKPLVPCLPDVSWPRQSHISSLPLNENEIVKSEVEKHPNYFEVVPKITDSDKLDHVSERIYDAANPITTSIRNSPLAKRLTTEMINKQESSFFVESSGDLPAVNAKSSHLDFCNSSSIWRENLASGTADRPWPVVPGTLLASNEDAGDIRIENQQTKKVTFADIVQAGIRAINKSKKENPELYSALKLQQSVAKERDVGENGSFQVNENYQRISSNIMQNLDALDAEASQLHRPSKYRTEPCTTFHTIGVCPYGSKCNFYHTDSEKNDAPIVSNAMRYKTRLCKTWQKAGECPYGAKCDFAHGTDDLASNSPYKPHYKTRMCKVLQQTGRCPYGAQCTFAHKQCELRTDISLIYKYKTEICKSWASGMECSHGTDCHFAHGERELKNEADMF